MKKKQYIIPLIEVELWNMQDLMKVDELSPNLPPDPGQQSSAPARDKVF